MGKLYGELMRCFEEDFGGTSYFCQEILLKTSISLFGGVFRSSGSLRSNRQISGRN